MPGVFLSHSSKDKEFVRELYRRLQRDGVDCFLDEESIEAGDNFVRALERAIDECKYIVFVLSPDFCNSDWVEVERTSSIADDPAGLKRKVIPLMLRDCRHLATFPRFLKQVQAVDVSTTELFEIAISQSNLALVLKDLGQLEPARDLLAKALAAFEKALPPGHRNIAIVRGNLAAVLEQLGKIEKARSESRPSAPMP
jgi:tetratricopeptide (TPR) repeat protein